MLCSKCGKNTATIHTVTEINGVRQEQHLCSECASQMPEIMNMFDTKSMFGSLFDMTNRMLQMSMTGGGLMPMYRLADPYEEGFNEVFEQAILPVLRGDEEQQKKEEKKPASHLEELKAQLDQAIKEERFEDCAKLRDEINKLKGE